MKILTLAFEPVNTSIT